jgi:glycosyltransferase involved in cell wall biosynthesis
VRPRILWLGTPAFEDDVLQPPAISLAAVRWQRALVEALKDYAEVSVVGYYAAPAWPRGSLMVRRSVSALGSFPKYCNLPFARNAFAANAVAREIEGHYPAHRWQIVLSYNTPWPYIQAAKILRERGVKWAPVIADMTRFDRQLQRRALMGADGAVFLSWAAYRQSRIKERLHLEGGVDSAFNRGDRHPTPVIMYSGALTAYGGVDRLLKAFGLMRRSNVELWITGKGDSAAVEEAASTDSRIRWLGTVPTSELRLLYSRAWVLVNPRPCATAGSEFNFPSKLLDYLASPRPIVSTMSPGLPPEYRLLVIPTGDDPPAIASALARAIDLDSASLENLRQRVATFAEGRTWAAQASRLVEWLKMKVLCDV